MMSFSVLSGPEGDETMKRVLRIMPESGARSFCTPERASHHKAPDQEGGVRAGCGCDRPMKPS